MAAIDAKDLRKSFHFKGREIEAVRGASFSVNKGEIFGLLGPNGAGKSTTINMISGILTKDSGSIRILGKDIEKDWEIRNKMSVSSAYYALSDILTVEQNLRVYGRIYGVRHVEKKIDELLRIFSLEKLRKKKISTLSSGEKTRTNICKGLINDPEVLLLDECTVGLDPDIAEQTRKIISDYKDKNKPAILFTTHYMYEAEELCDRIAFIQDGSIIKTDTSQNLKQLITKQRIELDFHATDEKLDEFFREKKIDFKRTKDTVTFEVDSRTDDLYRMMNSLFRRGYKVKDLEIHRPSLNDVFIKIARGEDLR